MIAMIGELGFDTVDVGSLDESWKHQPGTPVYVQNLSSEQFEQGLAQASPDRKPEWRANR